MAKSDSLGEFEQVALLALIRLRSNAYGARIRQEIAERTGRDVSLGAIYTTLERLERKGFVSSARGAPTPERGGRAKRFYKIVAPGERALRKSRETMDRMWEGLAPAPSVG
jgi:DNA-binding PadR family transcriptional regulator